MKTKSIHDLRKEGYKVRVIHKRKEQFTFLERIIETIHDSNLIKFISTAKKSLSPCGGETIIEIRHPDGREVKASAYCNDLDNYNRKLGAQIALGKALKNL